VQCPSTFGSARHELVTSEGSFQVGTIGFVEVLRATAALLGSPKAFESACSLAESSMLNRAVLEKNPLFH
jgi:hypothetical protein